MHYISTRGHSEQLSFSAALLRGLAPDGGLYVPQTTPYFDTEALTSMADLPYLQLAHKIIAPFVAPDLSETELERILQQSYATFRHPAITPLTQLDHNLFVLELFHGPTLAFKDLAMQFLGKLLAHVLTKQSRRATIVAATSGDTGAAAMEAFKGLANVDVFILYPHGRISEVQRRQMTSVQDINVHALAIDGTFDDCQHIVKSLFTNEAFRTELSLSGVNSINWARIVAQIVYYFESALALGSPHRPVSFTVPTGNFGNIFAGFMAKKMGLPIDRLVIATNENDILKRTMADGAHQLTDVHATQSPSMDIQISSNFERALFYMYDQQSAPIQTLMDQLRTQGGYSLSPDLLQKLHQHFSAYKTDEAMTTKEISQTYNQAGILLDPHTAVGVHAGRQELTQHPDTPMIVLGTAHPAKFPQAVEAATGHTPALPDYLLPIMALPERVERLPNDLSRVMAFMREHIDKTRIPSV